MFPFKKKPVAPAEPTEAHKKLNDTLDETDTRMGEALKKLRERLEQKERRTLDAMRSAMGG